MGVLNLTHQKLGPSTQGIYLNSGPSHFFLPATTPKDYIWTNAQIFD